MAEKLAPLSPLGFRRSLCTWYIANARSLPWRQTREPYQIWVSEIMLQQTRVAAVIDHYNAFLLRFPTLLSLALALEQDVLAAWSGLGYYRRARLLHGAAQFVVSQLGGELPKTSAELRSLPGIGEYTAAAIASIAFDEAVPVMDGNVERVLLRLLGQQESATTAARNALMRQAAELVPPPNSKQTSKQTPGEHNQAMMELGATICLPQKPLCPQCPVFKFCVTRGEHPTPSRPKMQSHEIAYLLATRKQGTATQVLLRKRAANASLMPGMWELPETSLESVDGQPALLRMRHSITTTNYYVRIHAERQSTTPLRMPSADAPGKDGSMWIHTSQLGSLALTGLARKALQRLDLMALTTLRAAADVDATSGKNEAGPAPVLRKRTDPRFRRV